MITLENYNTKKYLVTTKNKRFYMLPHGNLQTEQEEFHLKRVFSRVRVLDFIIKAMFFMLCVLIVFLDTDYENGEFMLVFVKYKCKSNCRNLKLTITHSTLLNLNRNGELEGEFVVQKVFLIAHIISVMLYGVAVIALFVFLALTNMSDSVISAICFALCGVSACVAVFMSYYTIKRYAKTVAYLNDYYQNYVF